MMDKGEEYYCHPELMDALFEDFPLTKQDYSGQYMSSFQDADKKNKYSEIKDVELKSNLAMNSIDFKWSVLQFYEDSQSMPPFSPDEMEKRVSRDYQQYSRHTNSFTQKATAFQNNDTVITNTNIRGMSDVANDILNKNVLPVPIYAENKISYFRTLTNETVEDQNNIEFSKFYHKGGKSVVNEMSKLLNSESTSNEKSEEKEDQWSTFTPNKCKQIKKLNAKRITWQNPCYSRNMYHLAYDEFINSSSFISLMAKGTPLVMKSINNSSAVPVCGTLNLTADIPYLDLQGHMSVAAYNKNIKYEDTLQDIKLMEFQLADENSLKTETYMKMYDSDIKKYQIFNIKNHLLTSTIRMQQKRKNYMKCILQEGNNYYEAAEEHKAEKSHCFNQHITTERENLDKRLKELTSISNTTTCPKYNKEMQNFLGVFLKTFKNNFQGSKINFCNEINVRNATPNTINTSNSSQQRNDADNKAVNICNSNNDNIFASLHDMDCLPEYTQTKQQLYCSSSGYHVISFPRDSYDKISKILPAQQISCGTISTELDIVVDHDLMTLIDKEVDISLKQYKNNSLQLPLKKPPKEVECQTDLSLNCNKIYKYQHSDYSDIFNLAEGYQMSGIYHKRDNKEVSIDDVTPTKRRCSTDVSEYQDIDIVKWKVERYLSNDVLPTDETNQIVPSSAADEEKYEFNTMELYSEEEVLKDKKDIRAYGVCTYNSNETNSVKLKNGNTSSHKSLNSINNRRPLRLGLSKRANTKRLHNHVLGHH